MAQTNANADLNSMGLSNQDLESKIEATIQEAKRKLIEKIDSANAAPALEYDRVGCGHDRA